jgi:MFS superfamily sulfate permease-like transporter
MVELLKNFLPFLSWFENYGSGKLRKDFVAGLTVALVLIPQSMAYAQLAGLPAYYGLYASFLPPMIASLFGSSLQLATGPVAVVSLMTAASLEPLAAAGSGGYIAYAILLAMVVGLLQFLLGVLRLGLVVNFLSHPVVNGFTNAAAIIIASSQLSKLFGVNVDSASHHYETIMQVVQEALHYTHWPTLLMGVLAFAIMYGLHRVSHRIPSVLVAVVVTTLLSWATGFERHVSTDISNIESLAARKFVQVFNTSVKTVQELAVQRTEMNKKLEETKHSFDVVDEIKTRHEINLLSAEIKKLKFQAHVYRRELRRQLFTGHQRGDGSYRFFPRDEVPDGIETDGRTWRILIGNQALGKEALVLSSGGAVVGQVPSGLPTFGIPDINLGIIFQLLPYAAIIALLGFMEAVSVAKAMAARTGQRLDPNQELIGQGLANMVGSMANSYPTSGSFSRSAVNLQAGAVSGLSSVFTSLVVVIVLLLFTPLLYHLPQAVLAAVIMMAVIGLINVSGFVHAWNAQRHDGIISVITFVSTLAFAPHLDKGIMIGVVLSLLVFLYKSMRPTIASLCRDKDIDSLECGRRKLKECEYLAVVRFDGPLFFANASYLEDRIAEILLAKPNLQHILLVSNGISEMDASGEETLSLMVDRLKSAGIQISLSGVNESVREVLRRTHLLEKIGREHLYTISSRAITLVHQRVHEGNESSMAECPMTMTSEVTEKG